MKLSEDKLKNLIESTEVIFKNYTRTSYLNKEDVINETKDFYDGLKNIIWLENSHNIKKILKQSKKPWVYHYTVNLNWVLFFTNLYEEHLMLNEEIESELGDIYLKAWRLKQIFNHVDGIIEDGDNIYLFKDDVSFIKNDITKWTI